MPKRHIVITSIQKPTAAVRRFAELPDSRLIVIGDKKTPPHWQHPGVHFIDLQAQEEGHYALAQCMPTNSYSRKMIGYIDAIRAQAEVIIDTDDDNHPKDNWHIPEFDGAYESVQENSGHINVYRLFSDQTIWPRGMPIKLITNLHSTPRPLNPKRPCRVGIWQGLADGDPDVDAIYRLTSNKPCFFKRRPLVVLQAGAISQINSQNTIHRQPFFPLLYLPLTVNFRFTDILRGYIAQPILWLCDYRLGFIEATVEQDRNPHDLEHDFFDEMQMYQSSGQLADIVQAAIKPQNPLWQTCGEHTRRSTARTLCKKNELQGLEAWLVDIAMANG